jgi:hypothetical protein
MRKTNLLAFTPESVLSSFIPAIIRGSSGVAGKLFLLQQVTLMMQMRHIIKCPMQEKIFIIL